MGGSIEGTSVVFKVFCSLKERRAICVCGVVCGGGVSHLSPSIYRYIDNDDHIDTSSERVLFLVSLETQRVVVKG